MALKYFALCLLCNKHVITFRNFYYYYFKKLFQKQKIERFDLAGWKTT